MERYTYHDGIVHWYVQLPKLIGLHTLRGCSVLSIKYALIKLIFKLHIGNYKSSLERN